MLSDAALLIWSGVVISLGVLALFITGRFGMFSPENQQESHDTYYIMMRTPLRISILLMPLVAGMLLSCAGIVLKKQIQSIREAAVRHSPEIFGQP